MYLKTLGLITLINSCCLFAQSFEAASLRLQESEGNNRQVSEFQVAPTSLIAHGVTLRSLIQRAWDVPPLAVSGPSLIDEGHYDLIARAGQPSGNAEMRLMLQHLLAERISIQAHVEKKEKKVYTLTVASNGPKFKESTADGPPEFTRSIVAGKTALVVHRATMQELANELAKKLKEIIVDETGLKARYDLSIDITTYAGNPGDLSLAENDILSILFASLPAQTGLKLDSRRQAVDLLIVDHIGPLKAN